MGDAIFVGRFCTRCFPGSLRIDDDLASTLILLPGTTGHRGQRCTAPTAPDRDDIHLGHEPAEQRNEHQFTLQDVAWILEEQEDRIGLP